MDIKDCITACYVITFASQFANTLRLIFKTNEIRGGNSVNFDLVSYCLPPQILGSIVGISISQVIYFII